MSDPWHKYCHCGNRIPTNYKLCVVCKEHNEKRHHWLTKGLPPLCSSKIKHTDPAQDIENPKTTVENDANPLGNPLPSAQKKRKHEEIPTEENATKKEVYIVVHGEDHKAYTIDGLYSTMNKARNFVKDALLSRQYHNQKWEEEKKGGGYCRWHHGCDFIEIFTQTLDYNWHDDISS